MSALLLDLCGDPAARDRTAATLPAPVEVLDLGDLRALGAAGSLRRLRRSRYDACAVLVAELRIPRRWALMVLLVLLARARRRVMVDAAGRRKEATWPDLILKEAPFAASRAWARRGALRRAEAAAMRLPPPAPRRPLRPRRVAMIRPDLGGPLLAGGSLAHVRGVASGLRRAGCEVRVFSPAPMAGFDLGGPDGEIVPDRPEHRTSVELPHLVYNETFLAQAVPSLRAFAPDLVYARHALGFYAAAEAARRMGVPLVVEYNGPETWIARHWGAARSGLATFERIENAVLRGATLVVAVSDPLRAPLGRSGVDPARVLVNPNGVDLDAFDPEKLAPERRATRDLLGAAPDDLVVGFVGTFGPWHGAEVAVRAAASVPQPLRSRLRWVFVGDGPRRAAAESAARAGGLGERVRFTGLVPQERTPGWVAAFDLALAPHVPNADGSPFFGSPTKLFEYLAAGKPVVASRLGQIGEVIEHRVNGWLVPPGDAEALAAAVTALAGDPPLRERLSRAARAGAAARHGWDAHVRRILDALASER